MMNFSRHATQVASKSFQGAATVMKKPTKREDYIETKWLFVSKSFLIMLLLGLVAVGCVIYFFVWPFLLSRFFTAHFWQDNEKVDDWSGKVVVYYDKEKEQPMYQGRLVEGVLQGEGTEYDEAGLVVYQGNFVDGLRTGDGTYYEEGVLVYEGDFSGGDYEGEGRLYKNGILSYVGDFSKNIPSGTGTEYDENGVLLYQGDFVNGVHHGAGTLYHESGEAMYIGGFADGLYEGSGRLMNEDGSLRYKGSFQEGVYHGEGVLYDETGNLIYEGGFSEGLYDGEGTSYEDGVRRYTGGYDTGLRSGEGTAYREDGSLLYKGSFADDQYNGNGTLYLEEDQGYLTAAFADGEPDGDVQWYIGGKLWYSGGVSELRPDGYGELYLRNGKKVYAGEMDRGTIDGQWMLSLSVDEVREAFAEATVAENRGNDGSFFIMNQELGLVVRCTLQSAEEEISVFSAWISRQDSSSALQDRATFNIWLSDLETDPRMKLLMPWEDLEQFTDWASGLQEGGYVSATQFPEHDMTKARFFLDGWYCTAAMETSTSAPVMVSWTVDGELAPVQPEDLLDEGLSAEQESMDALLESITTGDSGQTTEGHVGYLLSQTESPEAAKELTDCLLDLYENVHTLISLECSQTLLQTQLAQVQEQVAMGKAFQTSADDVTNRLDTLQLQISQHTALRDKTLLQLQAMTDADLSAYDLKPLMICFDPQSLSEEELCLQAEQYALSASEAELPAEGAQTGEQDAPAAELDPQVKEALRMEIKMAKINLQIAYDELQYQIKLLEQAAAAVQDGAAQFSMGSVDQTTMQELQISQSTSMSNTYSAMTKFVRQLNELNHLTGGWVSGQVGWLDTVFAEVYNPTPSAEAETAPEQGV